MESFYLTAAEFARRGRSDFPKEESPSHALIYSSPATLSYNSPGANGYGVKRAGWFFSWLSCANEIITNFHNLITPLSSIDFAIYDYAAI